MDANSRTIRIVRPPAGEAPLWVREAWVGLDLPLIGERAPKSFIGVGVLSGSKSYLGSLWQLLRGKVTRVTGYAVEASKAVGILAESNPSAAQWWQENAPHIIRPGRIFIFDEDACSLKSE